MARDSLPAVPFLGAIIYVDHEAIFADRFLFSTFLIKWQENGPGVLVFVSYLD